MKIIKSLNIPKANGHYSQCIEHKGILYISGQLPIHQETKKVPKSIEDQTDLTDLVDVTQHNTEEVEAVNEGVDPATLPDEPNTTEEDEEAVEEVTEDEISSLLPFLSPVTTLAMIALAGMFVSIRLKDEE